MDPKHIAKAKRIVREEFPEMAGAEPTVSARETHSKGMAGDQTLYVLTFKKSIPLRDGGNLKRAVRVTMDQAGEIVKLVSSK